LANLSLSLEGVVAGYGDGTVLHQVGLQLAAGERLALLGRNGAGKTTLMRAVMGLLPIRAGGVRYGEHRLDRMQTFEIARLGIAYVPQGRDIFGDFTVEQNLTLGVLGLGGKKGAAKGRAAAPVALAVPDGVAARDESALELACEAFPWLAERAGDRAGSLSGGQQQQLAIARALVSRPGLLMLDEPLEGIQPSIVEQIVAAIGKLCARHGTGLLLVEQNIDAVFALCERVVFLEGGQAGGSVDVEALRRDSSPIDRALGL
jgi:ABC-type branched-subunit amino acid transport system ATPase component